MTQIHPFIDVSLYKLGGQRRRLGVDYVFVISNKCDLEEIVPRALLALSS